MRKYPKIRYPSDEESTGVFATGDIVIQEKIDASNFRFTHQRNLDQEYWSEDRDIAFGSRNVQFKNQRDENKQFAEIIEYVRETVDEADIRSLEEAHGGSLTFFGEAMNPHTLEYDWENSPAFIGFDVWNETDEYWLTHTEMERAFDRLGLETAPIIDIVSAEAWDSYSVDVPESEYGDVTAEGLTFKNYDTQTFSKFVREDFKEKSKQKFGKPKKHQATGAEKLSYQYITNARIEKAAHKLVDEGDYDCLKMEMMQDLPEFVIRDMAEEEAGDLFMEERWEVDIAEFRSITSGRCASVLKHMIQQRAVDELRG